MPDTDKAPEGAPPKWPPEIHARPFEPYRAAKTAKARQLVADIVAEVQAMEGLCHPRQRARKAKDQATYVATVEAVVTDLIHLALSATPDAPTCVTITRSKLVLSRYTERYRAVSLNGQLPNILDVLHGCGFIWQTIGDRSQFALVFTDKLNQMRERRRTTIEPGRRLVHAIEQYGITFGDLECRGGEVLILKGKQLDYWQSAIPTDYAETPETMRLRKDIELINRWLARADLAFEEREPGELKHVDISDRCLRRIFTRGSFKSGGRFAGGFWMNLERHLRLTRLRIASERVASLDFSSLNPRLLYAKGGLQPALADLYSFPGLEAYRPGMKRLLNALLFDKEARKKKLKRTPEEKRNGIELFPPDRSISELIATLEAAHQPIAHHFGTGIGHELQFIESTILVGALLALKRAGITGLPVHDCVIVARSKVDEAKTIMGEVSRAVAGAAIPVTVEVVDD